MFGVKLKEDTKDELELDSETLLEMARYAFLRLDGAWFMAAAKKFGIEAATELDISAWEMFSERLAKQIVSRMNLKGPFAEMFPILMQMQNKIMKMNSEVKIIGKNKAIQKVSDCEIWKMVSKVWTKETVPCHKVTQASIRGLLKGAFPGKEFEINHIKKIPLGDPYCEVEIIMKD